MERLSAYDFKQDKPDPQTASLGAVGNDAVQIDLNPEIQAIEMAGRWSAEKANAWYDAQPWIVGCNYLPATAINQLEMWQAESFDPETMRKELARAQDLGFNTLRVFLHDLVWAQDQQCLYGRMDQFLACCDAHGMRALFVFFDDCHRPFPRLGAQPAPVAEYHNSGWMNSPARDLALDYCNGTASTSDCARLKGYVQETIRHFAADDRVLMWELYNEPGREYQLGSRKEDDWFGDRSARLLFNAWQWARQVAPSQPICSSAEGSVGYRNILLAKRNSDVYSFHTYGPAECVEELCSLYAGEPRPAICTEYMARPYSTFQNTLPILKKHRIGAINWGFIAGKSGTIWPWSSKEGKDISRPWEHYRTLGPGDAFPEPELWFHDIYRTDGTPFDPAEIEFIKQMMKGIS